MGGSLSCGGQGHVPVGDDVLPYGTQVTKPVGIVHPQEMRAAEETKGK